jgi:hypothetical protein
MIPLGARDDGGAHRAANRFAAPELGPRFPCARASLSGHQRLEFRCVGGEQICEDRGGCAGDCAPLARGGLRVVVVVITIPVVSRLLDGQILRDADEGVGVSCLQRIHRESHRRDARERRARDRGEGHCLPRRARQVDRTRSLVT